MPGRVDCPKCHKPLTFSDSFAGRVVYCPCGQAIVLPAVTPPAPSPPAWMVPLAYSPPAPSGFGGVPVVWVIGTVIFSIIAVAMFMTLVVGRMNRAQRARESRQRVLEEMKKAEQMAQRYVLVRWWVDDRVLPPGKRAGAEASKVIGTRVEVANYGYEPVAVDAMDFRLKADGVSYGRPIPVALEALQAGDLKDGATTSGGLVFEVPEEWKEITIDFTPARPPGVRVRSEEMK